MRAAAGFVTILLLMLSTRVHPQERARFEIPYRDGIVVITADRIEREAADRLVAQGDVVVTYEDTVLRTERLVYNPDTEVVVAEEGIEVRRGVEWLKGSRGEFDLTDKTGRIEDARGFTDEELFVNAKVLRKTGPETYVALNGFLTACEDALPKWSFLIRKATLKQGSWASFAHPVLRIKKVPVFYLPYVLFPTGKKERSSGLLIPSTGTTNQKGRRITQPFYFVLGRSADLLVREDYFSKRGLGHGFTFRARPNQNTFVHLDAYTIEDRLDQGGTSFNGSAESHFANGFRVVADFNLVSNFVFRRVFSDSFFTATRPNEASRVFATNNFGTGSFNFRLAREETVFPRQNTVIRHTPSFNFRLRGRRLPRLPLYLDLDATVEGVSRVDRQIETPLLTQRLDLHPEFYFSVPLFQGLRATPRFSFRETFYSSRLSIDEQGDRSVVNQGLSRRYFDFVFDLKGWGLSRIYRRSGQAWKHLIEPVVRYRYTTGIDNFDEIIRFDETDAIADTSELEYALWNRIFTRRSNEGESSTLEWLSLKIAQKYFFDPDFGGAFREDSVNQFFPLNTLTGFPYGAIRRGFSPVTTVARINPSRGYSIDVRGDYDFEFKTFRNFSVTGILNPRPFRIATTYFVTEELDKGTFENHQIQGAVIYGDPNRGFSASSIFSYDAQKKQLLNTRSRVNYFWDCCGVSVELQRINVGLREERQIRFSFFLKGIGAFGTIKRPDSIF